MMVIARTSSSPTTTGTVAAPAPSATTSSTLALAGRTAGLAAFHTTALTGATTMASAPSPLSVIPQDWFPNGSYRRPYSACCGFITAASGTASIERSNDRISVSTPNGDFSLRPDPDNPGRVIADTPEGTFSGTLRRNGNNVVFRTPDGRRSVTMSRGRGYTRFDTSGFGLADRGHLRVQDR